jgi:hypothetical protein
MLYQPGTARPEPPCFRISTSHLARAWKTSTSSTASVRSVQYTAPPPSPQSAILPSSLSVFAIYVARPHRVHAPYADPYTWTVHAAVPCTHTQLDLCLQAVRTGHGPSPTSTRCASPGSTRTPLHGSASWAFTVAALPDAVRGSGTDIKHWAVVKRSLYLPCHTVPVTRTVSAAHSDGHRHREGGQPPRGITARHDDYASLQGPRATRCNLGLLGRGPRRKRCGHSL